MKEFLLIVRDVLLVKRSNIPRKDLNAKMHSDGKTKTKLSKMQIYCEQDYLFLSQNKKFNSVFMTVPRRHKKNN